MKKKVNFQFRHTSHPNERSGIVLKWLSQLPAADRAEKINCALFGFWLVVAQSEAAGTGAVDSKIECIMSLTAQMVQLQNEFKIPLESQQVEQPLVPLEFPETVSFFYRYQSCQNPELFRFLTHYKFDKSLKILMPLQAYWEAKAIKALKLSSDRLLPQHAAYNFWQLKKQLIYLEGLVTRECQPKHPELKPSPKSIDLEVPTTYFLEDLTVNEVR